MKKLLITLCVIVLAVCVHAQPKVIEIPTATAGIMLLGGSGAAPVATCSTQSLIADTHTATGEIATLYDDTSTAFSFATAADEAGYLYSVKVNIVANEATTGSKTLSMRCDNDSDMTADILGGTATLSVAHDTTGEIEIIWAAGDRPQVEASTTYYIGFLYEPVAYGDRITIAQSSWIASGNNHARSADWTFGAAVGNYNVYSKVYICD